VPDLIPEQHEEGLKLGVFSQPQKAFLPLSLAASFYRSPSSLRTRKPFISHERSKSGFLAEQEKATLQMS
jgi:hypothetical protein